MIEETPKNEEFVEDHLFKLTMEKKWDQVVEIYKKHPRAHITKLTKSEETALHIAISSYHSQFPSDIIDHVKRMIDSIEKNCSLSEILSMQNVKGNTPLHLAAAVGCLEICKCIASKNHQLISIRNANGETPLFVAAHRGKMQAFLLLQEIYNDRIYQEEEETETEAEAEAKARDLHDESLCRRKDGNTILHSAICGEYFALAYQIISDYPKLVNSVNEEGESPLHVLARMPHVFRSSNQLGFCDSIIYYCVFVDELKQQKYNPAWTSPSGYTPTSNIKLPENYWTCMNVLFLLIWTPISKTISASFPRLCKDESGNPPDEENQELTQNEHHRVTDAKEKSKDDGIFPPNYTTCIRLFKFAMTVTLTVLGVGFWRIKKIKEKKERHSHAFEIMSKMIESESSYKYDSNGQRPVRKPEHEGIEIPDVPPHDDDESETNAATTPSTKSKHEKEISGKYYNKKSEKEKKKKEKEKRKKKAREWNLADTPLLVAAKMGIPEMVKKIISTCPVAIQDLDSDGKNVLLLAAENKHINVFDYLVESNLPEYMFHQVDNEGNSILHLAAMLGEKQPWRIPGSALQMQWEIKWYEHVKNSVPRLSFAHHNFNGETPRKIFTQTHEKLVKEGNEWLIKTSESCSVVAALIATVAFATSATVPGGLNESTGHPTLEEDTAFDIFSITSLVALCLSVTALVCFLAIITSRCEERDFRTNLPRKLLIGLTSLFASIAAMLLSFCAGHTFILREKLRVAAVPIYAVASVPISFFAVAQLPLYFDLMWAACRKVPLRSYKVFYQ